MFDRVDQTGQKVNGKPRLIVEKFNPSLGKELVLKYGKNLDRRKNFGVNVQLQESWRNGGTNYFQNLKKLATIRNFAKWSLNKLIIYNKLVKIETDTVRDTNTIITEVAKGHGSKTGTTNDTKQELLPRPCHSEQFTR